MKEDADAERRFHRDKHDVEALFRAHYPEIVRYLAVRLGSRTEAEDVAAEVFVAAFRGAPRLQWRGRAVLAWLYRVAANLAADHLRQRAREQPTAEVAAESGDAFAQLDERDALVRALRALAPDHQLVVHLRLIEGRPFAEVASIMGKSVGACQMLMLRAARALRDDLEREGVRGRV